MNEELDKQKVKEDLDNFMFALVGINKVMQSMYTRFREIRRELE